MNKKYFKNLIVLMLCGILVLTNLVACSNEGETTETESKVESTESEQVEATSEEQAIEDETVEEIEVDEIRTWTDSVGREVEIPSNIEKVALSGPLAQIVLYAFAPEMLVGFSNDWSEDAQKYIPDEYLSLPTLGQLYGGQGEMNLEELLASGAQIVIDIGEPKDSIVEDLDGLQEQTTIPFVHVTMTLEEADEAFLKLGDLLGLEERAEEFADYCSNVYSKMNELANEVKKADLLYITGENGLNVIAKDSFHAEAIDLMANNLAVVDEPSSKGTGNEVDMEQILNWNPDHIIFAPESIYDSVQDLEEWQSITAIKNGNYYEVPFGPYNWMGFPPSIQRYLGMLWMGAILYPDAIDYDLQTEVTKYYEMFYHTELTDEDYQELVANSVAK